LPFRDARTHFRDILDSIERIDSFVLGMDFFAYQKDIKTRSAVERQIQILTEAARRLGGDAESLCPGPDWLAMRHMGNFLRHAYHDVDDKIVWDTIKDELPPLYVAVTKAITGLPDP
jgi:uncharacterized protein with HEPN domain